MGITFLTKISTSDRSETSNRSETNNETETTTQHSYYNRVQWMCVCYIGLDSEQGRTKGWMCAQLRFISLDGWPMRWLILDSLTFLQFIRTNNHEGEWRDSSVLSRVLIAGAWREIHRVFDIHPKDPSMPVSSLVVCIECSSRMRKATNGVTQQLMTLGNRNSPSDRMHWCI